MIISIYTESLVWALTNLVKEANRGIETSKRARYTNLEIVIDREEVRLKLKEYESGEYLIYSTRSNNRVMRTEVNLYELYSCTRQCYGIERLSIDITKTKLNIKGSTRVHGTKVGVNFTIPAGINGAREVRNKKRNSKAIKAW